MKHEAMIQAALKGECLQIRSGTVWVDISTLVPPRTWAKSYTVHYLTSWGVQRDVPEENVRIKPEPVPDKVFFGLTYKYQTEIGVLNFLNNHKDVYQHAIKVTVKTDDNGKETTIAEVLK